MNTPVIETALFEASLFDELEPLFPDTNPREGKSWGQSSLHQRSLEQRSLHTVAAASGTYAGVHILLTGLTPGKCVSVEILPPQRASVSSDTEGSRTEHSVPDHRYKLFELLPLPVEANTGAVSRTEWMDGQVNPDVIRRAPFTVYDVLKPCTNVLTARGAVMALAFRCKVDSIRRETKKWSLLLTHDGISRKLDFLVEVFPVKVPEADAADHKYVNWFSHRGIADYHNAPLFSDEWYKMYELYLKLGKYGRQNMALVGAELFFDLEKGRLVLNESKLDRLMEIYNRVGIHWLEGGHLTGRKDGEWEATQAETIFTHRPIPGEGEAELADMGQQIFAYLQKHGLTERWIQSLMDEPLDCMADTYKRGLEILKSAMPGIPLLDASIARETIAGNLDYWCPTTNKYEKYQEFFDDRYEKGDHIFVYTCLDPAGSFCNRMLDQERLRQVWIGWAPALYPKIEGYLHWGGMSMEGFDPYYLAAPLPEITDYESSRSGVLPAGDAAIMYPGFHQVYSSTRLEAYRMGFEDLVLLQRLQERDPEWVDALVRQVFRGYDNYEKDVEQYRKIRRVLLDKASAESGNGPLSVPR